MLTSSASSDKSSDPSNIDPLNLASLVGSKPAGSKASTEAKSEDPSIQMSVSYIFTIILRIPKTSKPKITYYPFSKVDGVPDDPNNEITPDVFSYDINVQGMNKAKVRISVILLKINKVRNKIFNCSFSSQISLQRCDDLSLLDDEDDDMSGPPPNSSSTTAHRQIIRF